MSTPRFRPTRALGALALAAVVAVGLAACGDDDSAPAPETPAQGDDAFPVTVGSGDGEITLDARPNAVVSLSPTATEMLFAVGAGDQVVAVDDQSTYPGEAPRTALSGFTPNVEAIVGYSPDLVIVSDDPGDLVAGLERVGVPTLVLPAAVNLDDVYGQIEQVGAATGHVGDAAEVVSRMQGEIDEVVAGLPERPEPLRYYHELDPTFFSITDDTFVGSVYSMLGLESIATGGDGHPQLSAEYVVTADPDLIFLADAKCCGVDAAAVAERPGWGETAAVREGHVHPLDDDVASRWGPRVADLVRQVGDVVAQIPVTAPTR